MRISILIIDVPEDHVAFHDLEQLLKDLTLKFEATHMPVVSHHCESVPDYQQVEVLIKYASNLRFSHDQNVESVKCFKTDLHQLRLLVLHCEQYSEDNGLKFLSMELKETSCAMLDNVLDEFEA